MADFSDSDEESAVVEELISQTKDLCVLEQISAINCSGFSDSPLPSDLESRFRKLKSFPATKSKPPYFADRRFAQKPEIKNSRKGETEVCRKDECSSPSEDGKVDPKQQSQSRSISFPANFQNKEADFTPSKEDPPDGQKDLKVKVESGRINHHEHGSDLDGLTPSGSPNSYMDEEIFAPCKQNSVRKRQLISKSKPKLDSASSPFGSSSTLTSSPSPPRKSGCFWCSPTKGSSLRKSRENQVEGRRNFEWSKHDDFVEDIGSFSMKEHQKILKKAMKEQERISREADKIMQMAKQASARITTRFEDDLSDDDEITK